MSADFCWVHLGLPPRSSLPEPAGQGAMARPRIQTTAPVHGKKWLGSPGLSLSLATALCLFGGILPLNQNLHASTAFPALRVIAEGHRCTTREPLFFPVLQQVIQERGHCRVSTRRR